MRKVLVVDDSALMRRILIDVLKDDGRFEVKDTAKDGEEALLLLESNKYDVLILDINMPNMNGLEFMEELRKRNIKQNILVVSSDTAEGADVTIKALSLGAFDFIQKPKNMLDARAGIFRENLLNLLIAASSSGVSGTNINLSHKVEQVIRNNIVNLDTASKTDGKKRLVAIASSTGGPNSLQQVIPLLPKNLAAPVLLVQHMPAGFTKSLADRLNGMSELDVTEAKENEIVKCGHVYIAQGGHHMKYRQKSSVGQLYYSDEPAREGVKPCANYMFESLADSKYDEIVCVVLTGMGHDGTVGITNLKMKKNIYVFSQNESSSVVYGMPKSIYVHNLSDCVVDLKELAEKIVLRVGIL